MFIIWSFQIFQFSIGILRYLIINLNLSYINRLSQVFLSFSQLSTLIHHIYLLFPLKMYCDYYYILIYSYYIYLILLKLFSCIIKSHYSLFELWLFMHIISRDDYIYISLIFKIFKLNNGSIQVKFHYFYYYY